MPREPDIATWRLRAHDRFARSVTLTRENEGEYTVRIEPSNQQDEGETIRHLNRAIIRELAEIVGEGR